MKLSSLIAVFALSFASADVWNGADYVKNSTVQKTHAEMLLSGITLVGDEAILDVGCGDGRITEQLAKAVPDGFVVGIDPSASMLEKAEARSSHTLRFLQDSAETFTLEERFDHAISIHVMHWIKDQKAALTNIHRHLKPGAQLHIILAPSKKGLPFHEALIRTQDNWKDHFTDFVNPQQVFDIETYRSFLVESGFHIDALHYVYCRTPFESKDAFRNWVKQWLPQRKHLPEELQESFLDEFINQVDFSQYGEYVLLVHATRM
ncbi:MAG: methyltransferase domain-containing protein [Verrucomicrobia bacterium]|nr:methyltransferase domain-containing protein [Verrucomicrobiota bacterium]MBS0637182.1 methyltransferase domain-containing protein [Verrucomicrobiota bacterium]